MTKEFRQLIILYTVSAILVFSGFYLTSIPPVLQVIILFIGLIITIYTFIRLIKVLIRQFKSERIR